MVSGLIYVEAAAALAHAQRMDRPTGEEHHESVMLQDRLWPEIDIAEGDETVVRERGAGRPARISVSTTPCIVRPPSSWRASGL
jgi:hypothetical protein